MQIKNRDTVKLNGIEYICYLENDRIGIMIQDFFPERIIKETIDYIEEEREYFYLGIEVRDNDRYLIFKRDKSKLLDLSKLFSDWGNKNDNCFRFILWLRGLDKGIY